MFSWDEYQLTCNKNAKGCRRRRNRHRYFCSIPASDADNHLASKEVDVLLLGPQVRFMKADFEKRLEPKGIPLDIINMADYGLMNGEKVLQQALRLIESK